MNRSAFPRNNLPPYMNALLSVVYRLLLTVVWMDDVNKNSINRLTRTFTAAFFFFLARIPKEKCNSMLRPISLYIFFRGKSSVYNKGRQLVWHNDPPGADRVGFFEHFNWMATSWKRSEIWSPYILSITGIFKSFHTFKYRILHLT